MHPIILAINIFTSLWPNPGYVYPSFYWETHPQGWTRTDVFVGSVDYTKQQALTILYQPDDPGNGLVALSKQYIAEQLNAMNQADGDCICEDLGRIYRLIGGQVCPPFGNGWLDPTVAQPWTNELTNWNDGRMCAKAGADPGSHLAR